MSSSSVHLTEARIPLTRARCPPGMKMVEGFSKCQPMENNEKRTRFKEYLKSSKMLQTLQELTLGYILDECVKSKPANCQRHFAEVMAAQMGLGGKRYVENFLQDMKRETTDAYRRLANIEETYQAELDEQIRLVEEEINQITNISDLT